MAVVSGAFISLLAAGCVGVALFTRSLARRQLEVTPWVPPTDLVFGPAWLSLFVAVRRVRRHPLVLIDGVLYLGRRLLGEDPLDACSDEEIWLEARAVWRKFAGSTELFDDRRFSGECPPSLVRATPPVLVEIRRQTRRRSRVRRG